MPEKTRRHPSQARAEATVEAIFDATFQLLEREGVAALTTNHIAQRAGVSIGTLYQYFGGKAEILAAMAQRRAEAARKQIARTVIEAPQLGSVRPIVRSLMAAFEGSPQTRRVLLDALQAQGADQGMLHHHLAFLADIDGRARLNLTLSPESLFVLTHAVAGLLSAAAAAPGLGLSPAVLEDELVLLMESYLSALIARSSRTGL
ncbi:MULTISPECIES: TetR/AcrR family transcriptional regulator [unclassified Caulobacter]|uniref:TetR/AcrR family transcriptional regulator n=1 Tax=unclassified Caulobacter TaxID=2648921 RepID=UPI000D367580|nr:MULTISPECIES: TetR/AcrR family transcriptional regulator [unclassified Caulobacter]PTS91380.1 TetR/AcrR family transcriptional regulator [Caulobacter sp. HMWF009]PTT06058.1 TetR/AcrR family transcriptional regulator [Caulobacter sp. HMWF025]